MVAIATEEKGAIMLTSAITEPMFRDPGGDGGHRGRLINGIPSNLMVVRTGESRGGKTVRQGRVGGRVGGRVVVGVTTDEVQIRHTSRGVIAGERGSAVLIVTTRPETKQRRLLHSHVGDTRATVANTLRQDEVHGNVEAMSLCHWP